MKVLFLFPYPLAQSPSQRFRFEQYFKQMTTAGITYSCHSFWDIKTWKILYQSGHYLIKTCGLLSGIGKRILVLFKVYRYDLIFIHRECIPIGPPLMEWVIVKLFKKKIIYDFDDAIWLPNTSQENKLAAMIKCHWKVKSICKLSYKVSCGNEYLGDFAKQFAVKVTVNPTTIDTEYLHNPSLFTTGQSAEAITIGWTGTHSTLKYLNSLVPIIQRLEVKYSNLRFVVIANKKPDLPIKSLVFIEWSHMFEIEDLLQIEIGVMPLTDDKWTLGKCGFKTLQYMALNIPSVVSSVGINQKIIDHGLNGFLCKHEEDWFNYLSFLIENSKVRQTMGIQARKKIIDSYSVSSNSPNFLSLFE